MTDPEIRQPTLREALIQRMLFRAETWERGTYGDQGLRLMAEDSAKLLRDAADLLREEPIIQVLPTEDALRDQMVKQAEAIHDKMRKKFAGEIAEWKERAEAAEAKVADLLRVEGEPDNGNTFVFCDFVTEHYEGCVRGAGHDGAHAVCQPPYPLGPVKLVAPASRVDPVPPPPHQDEQKG